VSANSPVDRVIGVGWGLSSHASSFNLLLQKKFSLAKMSPGNLLEIISADLLDTLLQQLPFTKCSLALADHFHGWLAGSAVA